MDNAASANRPFLVFAGSIPGKTIIMFCLIVQQVRMFSLLLRRKSRCLRFFSTEGSGSATLPNVTAVNYNQLDISGLSTAGRYFKELESRSTRLFLPVECCQPCFRIINGYLIIRRYWIQFPPDGWTYRLRIVMILS
jgi:hypothetical protein